MKDMPLHNHSYHVALRVFFYYGYSLNVEKNEAASGKKKCVALIEYITQNRINSEAKKILFQNPSAASEFYLNAKP